LPGGAGMRGGRRWRVARMGAGVPQALGVAAGEAPVAVAFVLAAELVTDGRMAAGCGSVTHSGQFGPGE
jgi:hypothetical protein